MNRQDLKALSRLRACEAKILLDHGAYAGSYYLMGYALECAIKAMIAKRTKRHDFPNKRLANDSYSHSLFTLLKTAETWSALEDAMTANDALCLNWTTAKDWTETSRYTISTTEAQARALYTACTSRDDGLLPWLMKYW